LSRAREPAATNRGGPAAPTRRTFLGGRRLNWQTLNWLDTSIALIVLTSAFVGLLTGLVRELVSVASLSLAIGLSSALYGRLAAFLDRWIDRADIASLAAFLGILPVAWLAAGTAGLILSNFLLKGRVSLMSRLAGSLVGFVKGLALSVVVLMVLTVYLPSDNRAFRESRIYPTTIQGARLFAGLLPLEQRLILLRRIEPRPERVPSLPGGVV
jgi:membrane protein required for colicin V production